MVATFCTTGQLAYNSQSPDEAALVSAAKNFGFVFKVHNGQNFNLCLTTKMHMLNVVYLLCPSEPYSVPACCAKYSCWH